VSNPFDRFAIEPSGADREAVGRVAGADGILETRSEITRLDGNAVLL